MDLEELRVRTGFNKLSGEATAWMEMGSTWSENRLEKVLNAGREVSEGWAGPNPSPKNWQNDAISTVAIDGNDTCDAQFSFRTAPSRTDMRHCSTFFLS